MKTGKVYKIIHNQSDIVYIGSTFNTLRDRWSCHKNVNSKCVISDHIQKHGANNFKIILIKEYEVVDKKHLEAYESLWISKTRCINVINPFRVAAFYRKKYYIQNKERINQYQEDNRDHILERKKHYRNLNKDKIKEYRDKHAEYYKEKIKCEVCKCEFRRAGISRHNKTKKHLENVK